MKDEGRERKSPSDKLRRLLLDESGPSWQEEEEDAVTGKQQSADVEAAEGGMAEAMGVVIARKVTVHV